MVEMVHSTLLWIRLFPWRKLYYIFINFLHHFIFLLHPGCCYTPSITFYLGFHFDRQLIPFLFILRIQLRTILLINIVTQPPLTQPQPQPQHILFINVSWFIDFIRPYYLTAILFQSFLVWLYFLINHHILIVPNIFLHLSIRNLRTILFILALNHIILVVLLIIEIVFDFLFGLHKVLIIIGVFFECFVKYAITSLLFLDIIPIQQILRILLVLIVFVLAIYSILVPWLLLFLAIYQILYLINRPLYLCFYDLHTEVLSL